METNDIHKEIDLIQACIKRMSRNSFWLKGWCITLLVAMMNLCYKDADALIVFLGFIMPICIFWGLDAFFLRTEKMYRKMYEWVLQERRKNNEEYLFDLNPSRFKNDVPSYMNVVFSKTLFPIYGIPFLITLFAEFYFFVKNYCCCC